MANTAEQTPRNKRARRWTREPADRSGLGAKAGRRRGWSTTRRVTRRRRQLPRGLTALGQTTASPQDVSIQGPSHAQHAHTHAISAIPRAYYAHSHPITRLLRCCQSIQCHPVITVGPAVGMLRGAASWIRPRWPRLTAFFRCRTRPLPVASGQSSRKRQRLPSCCLRSSVPGPNPCHGPWLGNHTVSRRP